MSEKDMTTIETSGILSEMKTIKSDYEDLSDLPVGVRVVGLDA